MPLRFLIDEDSRAEAYWHAITVHNRASPVEERVDAIRVDDAGAPRLGTKDKELLLWAASAGRIVVSRDANTLIRAHEALIEAGRQTPGIIIVSRELSPKDFADYLYLYGAAGHPWEFASTVRFFPAG